MLSEGDPDPEFPYDCYKCGHSVRWLLHHPVEKHCPNCDFKYNPLNPSHIRIKYEYAEMRKSLAHAARTDRELEGNKGCLVFLIPLMALGVALSI